MVGTKGIYTCGGEPLSIRFSSPAVPGGLRPRVLDLVEPQLRAVGIELVREFWPGNVIFSQVLPAGRFEVAIMAWRNSGPSYLGKEVYGSGGEFNWTGYNQRLVTADLDQAQRILNGEQQARVVNRADRQLAQRRPGDSPLPVGRLGSARLGSSGLLRLPERRRRAFERGGLVARRLALAAALVAALLPVSGAGGVGRADAEARRHARVRAADS